MSEEIASEAGSNVDISSDPISQEIGSGNVAEEVVAESGNGNEISGEQAAAIDAAAEEIQDAIDEGASEEVVQELIKTFQYKVNGEDREVTLDLNNEEDIIRRIQMAEASQENMQHAAEKERNLDGFIQNLIDNPWETLEEAGYDIDKLAEDRIQNRIDHLQKSPEQIAKEERDSELEDLRRQIQEQDEMRETQEFSRLQEQAEIDLDNQITDALSSTTQLPKSPYIVKRVADAMLSALDAGREDVTPQDVIPWVEKEISEEFKKLFEAAPDKALSGLIGKNTMDRLRKQRLSKMPAAGANKIVDRGQSSTEQKVQKKVKLNDWLKGRSNL